MSASIEATSLSSIQTLANQPPAQARGAESRARPALTLYIIRVPGSRDVFLTTLKPKEKVVNALDIASSFYYFHFQGRDASDATQQKDQDQLPGEQNAWPEQIPQGTPSSVVDPPFPNPVEPQPKIHRKPLGPRALPARPSDDLGFDDRQQQQAAGLEAYPAPSCPPSDDPKSPQTGLKPPAIETESVSSFTNDVFSIVRRDPSSESQVNVGDIIIHRQTADKQLRRRSQVRTSSTEIFIDTSGYEQFSETGGFRRCIQYVDPKEEASHEHKEHRGKHDKHILSFQSPWNGTCEFITGVSGRSLKCVHSGIEVADSGKPSENTISDLRLDFPSSSFLGMIHLGHSKSSESRSQRGSLQEAFKMHFHRSLSTDSAPQSPGFGPDEAADLSRMNLSLGQEAAGGGSRGNKAKLGKLIVDGEGQDMLDLVVAANVAVFINIYESGR